MVSALVSPPLCWIVEWVLWSLLLIEDAASGIWNNSSIELDIRSKLKPSSQVIVYEATWVDPLVGFILTPLNWNIASCKLPCIGIWSPPSLKKGSVKLLICEPANVKV